MNSKLFPKNIQKIGDNYVLWFESTNSYTIISSFVHSLLSAYIESEDEISYINFLQRQHNLAKEKANDYNKELYEFLKDMNTVSTLMEIGSKVTVIPNPEISKYYKFGELNLIVNYSSNNVLFLIHPQFSHACVEKSSNKDIIFDVFLKDGLLYLYKNQSLIGEYSTKNYHLLQGKFAMELVASLYNNTESAWLATFHASTICNEHEAIMIIGDSGNGKSTLSALLMAHGLDVLADDFSPMLAENQNLYRFPAAISIKKGAFPIIDPLFKKFNTLEPHINNSKQITVKYLPPSQEFSGSKKNFECRKIVLVKYDENSTTELKECPPEILLKTLIPDSWISPREDHSIQFLNWLTTLKFYQLTYNNNDMAIAKFEELFEF